MVARSSFKLPGFTTYVDRIKNKLSEEAAREITNDLKEIGPYWSGDFEEAWVVKKGNVRINATRKPSRDRPIAPRTRKVTPIENFPKQTGRSSNSYTIGNEMVYRNIALDLEPGRIKDGGNETAPQDWYRTYAEGGNLRLTLQQTTAKVAKDPSIRGFKK